MLVKNLGRVGVYDVMIIFKSMKCFKWDSLIFCECGYTFVILSSGLGL